MADGSDLRVDSDPLLAKAARQKLVPPDVLLAVARSVGAEADWRVVDGALDALLRRAQFAVRDELKIASKPGGRAVLGEYETRRHGRGARPYRTRLDGVAPLAGSCSCPDFVRSGLGVCKHVLAVAAAAYDSERRLARARREQQEVSEKAALEWQPELGLNGPVDRLAGLRWQEPQRRGRTPALAKRVAELFGKQASPDGASLRPTVLNDEKKRREAIATLSRAVERGSVSASPAVERVLAEERTFADVAGALADLARRPARATKGLKRKLYPYQRESLARLLATGRLLLADDMGLGKTVQAIAACHALYHGGRARRGLIVVPASLKEQWLREWQSTTDVPIDVIDAPAPERARTYSSTAEGFLITNYEALRKDLPAVREFAPDLVVLDEAQRIKNWDTQTARIVKRLEAPYRVVLTGTPMENRLDDLASVLDFVDDRALAPKWLLRPWHIGNDEYEPGARNLNALRARLDTCMLRRIRRDVIAQLPERTDVRVPVDITEEQALAHDELNLPIARLLATANRRPLRHEELIRLMTLFQAQRQISAGMGLVDFEEVWPAYCDARTTPSLLDGLRAPKLHELRRLIEELVLRQERRVIVFSQWRRMLLLAEWATRDLLRDNGLATLFFTGKESLKKRADAVIRFHEDSKARVMFLTDAGGVGLNLQQAASACIHMELPWNPAVLEQRTARIYRLGQRDPVDIYAMVTEYGIEQRIEGLINEKSQLFSSVFDGTSDVVSFDRAGTFLETAQSLVSSEAGDTSAASEAADGSDEDARDEDGSDEDSSSSMDGADEDTASGVRMERHAPAPAAPSPVAPTDVGALLGSLRVAATEDGGLRIEAPPETAGTLASLFEGLAKALRASQSG